MDPVVEAWMSEATCSDMDAEHFFAKDKMTQQVAKTACLTQCPVQLKCLAYALRRENGDTLRRHGIWGGLDPKERRALQLALDTMKQQEGEESD